MSGLIRGPVKEGRRTGKVETANPTIFMADSVLASFLGSAWSGASMF